jgi:hypothetical protein
MLSSLYVQVGVANIVNGEQRTLRLASSIGSTTPILFFLIPPPHIKIMLILPLWMSETGKHTSRMTYT